MVPALTKTTKNGHGIHVSSPSGHGVHLSSPSGHGVHLSSPSAPGEAEGGDQSDVDLDNQRTTAEDNYAQKLWLSPSFLSFLDSCLPGGVLELSDNCDLPQFQFLASPSDQGKLTLLPSPSSLFNILSTHKSLTDPATDLQPGALDTFMISVDDGGDRQEGSGVPPHRHGGAFQSYEPGGYFEARRARTPSPTSSTGKGMTFGLLSSCAERTQHCSVVPGPPTILEETAGIQQTDPVGRAGRLQAGPRALPSERAAPRDHSQRRPGPEERGTSRSPHSAAARPGLRSEAAPQSFAAESPSDSEATASSSSSGSDDDDDDDEMDPDQGRPPLRCSRRRRDHQGDLPASPTRGEVRWLGQRAEMGSRWSWLLVRLAELEGRIRHVAELRKHFQSTKVGVVLGDSQQLTDQQQLRQALLNERLGPAYRAGVQGGEPPGDDGCEHSSPTCLLRNIETQCARLSQIVTSLSPHSLSKAPHAFMGVPRTACCSPRGVDGRRGARLGIRGRRRPLLAPRRGCCARARPLLAYHKHRLLALERPGGAGAPRTGTAARPATGPAGHLTCGTSRSDRRSASSRSSDTPFCSHLQRVPPGERWSQRPMGFDVIEPSDPTLCWDGQHRSGHRRTPRARPRGGVSPHKTANRRRRKRRRGLKFTEDEECLSDELCGHHEISELLEEAYTEYPKHTHRLDSQEDAAYDDAIIPVSLAAGAKVKRKPHILTPSYRLVTMPSSLDVRGEEEEVEVVTDEAFLQRHLQPEQRETLRRSSGGRRRSRQRSTRPARGKQLCREVGSALLEMDKHPGMEEKLMPAAPWEPRVFPLAEPAEEAPPAADLKASTVLCRAVSFSILSSYGASAVPSAGQNRNSRLPTCSC